MGCNRVLRTKLRKIFGICAILLLIVFTIYKFRSRTKLELPSIVAYKYMPHELSEQANSSEPKHLDSGRKEDNTTLFYNEPPLDQQSTNILNSQYCKIPRTQIMPPYYKKYWSPEKFPNCDYEQLLATVNPEGVVKLLPKFQNSRNCCIQEIRRGILDDLYKISSCEPVEIEADMSKAEMFLLRCNTSFNFEANLPISQSVQKKINYWENRKAANPESLPFSVILIGVDTTSRSQAFRGMPRLVPLMERMGFIDFQAYHSLAASTLTMFMAFLMGMTREEVRKTCSPTWNTPFDNCPLIWKNYSDQNFVTMYVEDGPQTFNWGGQSGFDLRPTDYYIHNLFTAIDDLRLRNFPYATPENTRLTEMQDSCTSNETVPQFINRYTKRFIQKFHHTPFFSFTWFAYPFHDYGYALQNFEADLLNLFEYILSVPSILNNTIIIFTSDHGNRGANLNYFLNFEDYIERGLPPLFIRLPDRLISRYTDLPEVLRQNAKELVSPFDLHHTLLHLLKLDAPDFSPSETDRASLIIPLSETGLVRNCENLKISREACVCNVLLDGERITSPYYLGRIAATLQRRLRFLVSSTNYTAICALWTVTSSTIINTQVIYQELHSKVIMVRFEANPGNAIFEAKMRILQNDSPFDKCRVIGNISRLSMYRDQSSCVGFNTDLDKEMKAFCMCKSKVPASYYVKE